MRKAYWYISAYARKHGFVFFASLIAAIAIFSLIMPQIISWLEKQDVTYVGYVGEYSLANLPPEITQKISVGLTQVQPDGTVLPVLAERWTIEQEGTSYRFLIKEGIKWQDGKPLESNDITYPLKDVEIIRSESDIVFKLPEAYTPFPSVVSAPLFREGMLTTWYFQELPTVIGLGEYRISHYELDGTQLTSLTIENDTQRYVYRFYLTEEVAISAFKRGEVDVLPEVSQTYGLDSWINVSSQASLDQQKALALFFDTSNPIFDKNVRQAFAYAISKPTDTTRAIGPISPNSWAFFPGGKSYQQDQGRAVERLLSAVPPQPLHFELTTTPLFTSRAEQIKKELETLGDVAVDACQTSKAITEKSTCANLDIQVQLKVTNFPDVTSFQVLLTGQVAPLDPDQYQLWHSEQSTNFTRYKNTRIDKLLEDGRKLSTQAERKQIYEEFQQFFLEDVPAIYIEYLPTWTIQRQRS